MNRLMFALSVLMVTSAARAQTYYAAAYTSSGGCGPVTSSSPVSLSGCESYFGCAGTSALCSVSHASSGPFAVRSGTSLTTRYWQNFCGGFANGYSDAYWNLPVIFTGPGPSVTVQAQADFEWLYDYTATGNVAHAHLAEARFEATVGIGGGNTGGTIIVNGGGVHNYMGANITPIDADSFIATGRLTTPPVNVPTGVPVVFVVRCTTGVGAGAPTPSGTNHWVLDGTGGPPAIGAVFILPPGYTANSEALGIGGNQMPPVACQNDGLVTVYNTTPQSYLDQLSQVTGCLILSGVGGFSSLQLPTLIDVDGSFLIRDNPDLTAAQAPLLGDVGGDVEISGNQMLGEVDLSGLLSVGESVIVTNNSDPQIDFGILAAVGESVIVTDNSDPQIDFNSLFLAVGESVTVANNNDPQIDLGGLNTVGGDVAIVDNNDPQVDFGDLSAVVSDVEIVNNNDPQIDLGGLNNVGGDVVIVNNNQTTPFTVVGLQTIGGSLEVRDNVLLPAVSMPLLSDIDGNLILDGNTSAQTVDLGDLDFVGGNVEVVNNDDPQIDLGDLGFVGGNVEVENNDDPQIDLGDLGFVGGNVVVVNNDDQQVDVSSLTDVGGSVTLETSGDVDLSNAAVAGNTDISADGAASVDVQVPGGTTSVEMCNDAACMDADLPDDAAPAGTPFGVLHVAGAGLDPADGLDAEGDPATVDPVAAYSFSLGGTLAAPASLVFELALAALSPAEQTAVLDAYVAGRLTLTVQSDTPGSVPQARAQCGPMDPLVADGCVQVGAFDALGFQLPPGETAGAVRLRIAALVSHFSTYALSIVTPIVAGDCDCDGALSPADVEPFALALIDPAAYAGAHPSCPISRADANADGASDARDVQAFVDALLAP